MNTLTNAIQNSVLEAAPRPVVSAIRQASDRTGVDFAYLVNQANTESSFNPNIKARTSSATGLFQFIESTWLHMVEKHGHKYGIETEGKSRHDILEMRKDPKAASFMAAEFASENEKFLDAHWGGDAGPTELYFAHFLGPSQAAAFLKARDENPLTRAADLFPQAARSNPNVFYDRMTGRARTLEGVYAFFDGKFSAESFKPSQPSPPPSVVREPAANRIAGYDALAEIYGTPKRSGAGRNFGFGTQDLTVDPVEIMLMSQLDHPLNEREESQPGRRESGNFLYNT